MSFAVTHTYTWVERNVVPPKCRKPRDIQHPGQTLTVEVSTATADEAPVAILERATTWTPDGTLEGWHQLRWWNGKLWDKYRPWSQQTEDSLAGSQYFPAQQRQSDSFVGNNFDSHTDAKQAFERWAQEFLIVDDVVYTTTGEPRYCVMTFGFGFDHGGTALMTERGFNTNIPMIRHFTAAQFEEARDAAVQVALKRSDTASAKELRMQEPTIRVLIPEAQTLVIPSTYRVTVRYVEEVTLVIVAGEESQARREALAGITDDGAVRNQRRASIRLLPDSQQVHSVELVRLAEQEDQ